MLDLCVFMIIFKLFVVSSFCLGHFVSTAVNLFLYREFFFFHSMVSLYNLVNFNCHIVSFHRINLYFS